jgi:hypothetical protein
MSNTKLFHSLEEKVSDFLSVYFYNYLADVLRENGDPIHVKAAKHCAINSAANFISTNKTLEEEVKDMVHHYYNLDEDEIIF